MIEERQTFAWYMAGRGWNQVDKIERNDKRFDRMLPMFGGAMFRKEGVTLILTSREIVERDFTVYFYDTHVPTFTLTGIYTDELHRRKGAGSQALDDFIECSRAVGITRILLEPCPTVRGKKALTRNVLVHWYARKGFKWVPNSHEKIMIKELTP